VEDRRKNLARPRASATNKPTIREYLLVLHGRRWDVQRNNVFTGAFAYELDVAIGLATAEAKRDTAYGMYALVCVDELDGICRHVWP
jgi:hypothetical protein